MADDKEDVLEDNQEEKKPKSKKMLIIIVAIVLLLAIAGGVGYFLFMVGPVEKVPEGTKAVVVPTVIVPASYVAMRRPFVFNVPDGKRTRLVQIKVQLLVRGSDHRIMAKIHTPTLEGALVSVFSNASIEEVRTVEGKKKLRLDALNAVNNAIQKLEGKKIIESVLFTGFILQ
ncbi:MAG: flagellar basal body-associated FliL family protein [Psychromonas sp.]|nr:flagellar basal body-associated FliL family protein [Psychromonas sp.]